MALEVAVAVGGFDWRPDAAQVVGLMGDGGSGCSVSSRVAEVVGDCREGKPETVCFGREEAEVVDCSEVEVEVVEDKDDIAGSYWDGHNVPLAAGSVYTEPASTRSDL